MSWIHKCENCKREVATNSNARPEKRCPECGGCSILYWVSRGKAAKIDPLTRRIFEAEANLKAAERRKTRNENAMSNWAISGQMEADLKETIYWTKRLEGLNEEALRRGVEAIIRAEEEFRTK